jgi:hypothetical protein
LIGHCCITNHSQGCTTTVTHFEKPTSNRGDVIVVDFHNPLSGIHGFFGVKILLLPRTLYSSLGDSVTYDDCDVVFAGHPIAPRERYLQLCSFTARVSSFKKVKKFGRVPAALVVHTCKYCHNNVMRQQVRRERRTIRAPSPSERRGRRGSGKGGRGSTRTEAAARMMEEKGGGVASGDDGGGGGRTRIITNDDMAEMSRL